MKRRDFLYGSAGIVSSGMVSRFANAAGACPPPALSTGGTSTVTLCSTSRIQTLAASLTAGQSIATLGDTGLDSVARHTIQWSNRFYYDYANGRAHLMGKNASSQGSQTSNCLYNAATNSWTYGMFGGNELGHIYESIAYDPAAGELYRGQWAGGKTLKRWTQGNNFDVWTDPVTVDFSAIVNPETQPSLCWHPNLFGPSDGGVLALRGVDDLTVSVVAWRRANNQWYTVPNTTTIGMSGDYVSRGAIEYVSGGDFCIATFPGSGGKTFKIPAGTGGSLAAVSQVSNPPIGCTYGDNGSNLGILIDDPSGAATPYILEKGGSNRVWKYNAGSWLLKNYTHPFPYGGTSTYGNWIVAACRPLGVFWVQHDGTSPASLLWRPND